MATASVAMAPGGGRGVAGGADNLLSLTRPRLQSNLGYPEDERMLCQKQHARVRKEAWAAACATLKKQRLRCDSAAATMPSEEPRPQ
jgi:hypothetical protein